KAAGGHTENAQQIEETFASAVRSGEIKGLSTDPETLGKWVEKLTKIAIATGVDPKKFLSAQRMAGPGFLALDDDGQYGFAAFVQEYGQKAGVQLRTTFTHLTGGNNQTVRSNEFLRSIGLLPNDPKVLKQLAKEHKIKLNSDGQISRVNDMGLL